MSRSSLALKEIRLPLHELRLDAAASARRGGAPPWRAAPGTPASSNITRPGLTTATQCSGEPLPEPMRVSAGFLRARLVREDVDPDLAAALDLARHRDTGRLDLAVRDPAGLERLEPEVAELHLGLALRDCPRGGRAAACGTWSSSGAASARPPSSVLGGSSAVGSDSVASAVGASRRLGGRGLDACSTVGATSRLRRRLPRAWSRPSLAALAAARAAACAGRAAAAAARGAAGALAGRRCAPGRGPRGPCAAAAAALARGGRGPRVRAAAAARLSCSPSRVSFRRATPS